MTYLWKYSTTLLQTQQTNEAWDEWKDKRLLTDKT